MVKNPPASAGDERAVGSIPGLGRFPGGGHGNPLQYSCLENPMDRGAWRATVHGVSESRTRLTDCAQHSTANARKPRMRSFSSPKEVEVREERLSGSWCSPGFLLPGRCARVRVYLGSQKGFLGVTENIIIAV